jgi:ethanolamine utilization protein
MTDISKKEIAQIVRQVLQETGPAMKSSARPAPRQKQPLKNGPVVLNIFHAGVHRLEEALRQVKLIENTARRSSVYTVESARSHVCGADVREGAGIKCILDTVRPEGLEKALLKAEILVLPTFCLKTAAKVANLICDDQESAIVFSALLQGKKVLAADDGFLVCDLIVNENLRAAINQILKKLEAFGMVFCTTDQLHATFQKTISGNKKTKISAARQAPNATEEEASGAPKLVTAKEIRTAVAAGQDSLKLAPGGIVTPLARDLAREYSIQIIKTN